MRRKAMWIGVASLIVLIGVSAVHARGHRNRQHHFAGPRFEELDLTAVQKRQLKSLRVENHKQMIQIRADMELAQVELRELLSQKSPDLKAVDKAVARAAAAQSKMMASRAKQKLAFNKILTDEQFRKLEEMPKGPRYEGRGFRERRGGPGPGMGMGEEGQPEGPAGQRSRI